MKDIKRIVNGKTYNTETAQLIEEWDNGLSVSDFNNVSEVLYKTKKGAYFLAGYGGALSRYSQPCGDMTGGGEGLEPVSETQALKWLERHDFTEAIEKWFPHLIEEA